LSNVGQVAWIADGSGLALIATEQGTPSAQIWYLSYPEGELHKISNDHNNYSRLSPYRRFVAALVTVQTEGASSVWVRAARGREPRQTDLLGRYDGAEGLSWMPDGRVV
jgi:hypothetical protein